MCLPLIYSLCVLFGVAYSDQGYFWHVTDFHWDFSYWTEQLSCNGVDIPSPGQFGDQWCDSPWELIQASMSALGDLNKNVDFMLWTGDSVPHVNLSYLSTDMNKEIVRNITILMKNTFPGTKIYATFGNHDYYKKDQFPPHGNEIYNATYLIWQEWINDITQEANFRKGGYYSVLLRPKLRLMALNSNFYYRSNRETANITDPADQFDWMDKMLAVAASNQEKVIITGHVPPGYTTPRNVRWMAPAFNERFVQVIVKHADVISALYFGHEHHDSFRLFNNLAGEPVASLLLAPSITPWRFQISAGIEPAHNPGARLVKYDRQTGKPIEILQYYINLNQSNSNGRITWLLGYNTSSMYQLSDLSPQSLAMLVGRMTDPNSSPFIDYVTWYNTNGSVDFQCDADCYKSMLCGIKHMQDAPFQDCLRTISCASHLFCGLTVLFIVAVKLLLA